MLRAQSAVNLLTTIVFFVVVVVFGKTDITNFKGTYCHLPLPALEPNLTHIVYPGRTVWTFTFEMEEISSNFI